MKNSFSIVHIPRRFVLEDWGGTETFITEVSKRLIQKGHTSSIHTSTALSKRRQETYATIPIKRYPYFYPYLGLTKEKRSRLDKKAGNLFSWSLLKALKKEASLDIIHLHTGKRLGGIGRFAARRRGIPYVISLHGGVYAVPAGEASDWTDPLKHTLEWGKILGLLVGSRKVLQDASAVICVGHEEYEAVKKHFPENYVVYLPNGVDIERFSKGDGNAFRDAYAIPRDAFVLLNAARLDPQKNQAALIRSLPKLIEENPRVHLLMLGNITNTNYHNSLLKLIADLDLEEHITIIPGVPYESSDLVNAYHCADVFVLPSLHEPFGMVVLEAWAAGLPVAAASRGGLKKLIKQGETGLLLDPEAQGDSELIASLQNLTADQSLRRKLAEAGRKEAVDSYSWEKITDSLISIYRKVYEDFIS